MSRVLILGGTAEARELAAALVADGLEVTSSLAGRVAQALPSEGKVRIGGFGGPDALTWWLAEHGMTAVVDATHPFAHRISAAAATACRARALPLTRLERPGWKEAPGDRWHRVADLAEAAATVERLGRRVLLTTGRRDTRAFAAVPDAWFLIRAISAPDPPLPIDHEVLLDRGPYTCEAELELLDRHRIDLLVTKDSGGDSTAPKLQAARERGTAVVMVTRPIGPDVPTVATVAEVVERIRALPSED